MTEDAAEIVGGLSGAQREALCSDIAGFSGWIAPGRPGNTYSVLAGKGFFDRKSDRVVWGRSVYRLTALGKAVRAHLLKGECDEQ